MTRYYYANNVTNFLHESINEIYGEITSRDQFPSDDLQKNTWKLEINILKRELADFPDGYLLFEYTVPRVGDRLDNVLLYKGLIIIFEFKGGESSYPIHAIEQVTDYALDLKCFHKESHDKFIVPILVATEAPDKPIRYSFLQKDILDVVFCNKNNINQTIKSIVATYKRASFNHTTWINSLYMPTPTIIEAAQALYRGHNVEDISRNDAHAINLSQTTKAIDHIIDYCKTHKRKAICFITGVPGSGKTLAGLNLSIERQKVAEEEHAVFLSGNGPLVDVLHEALARDDVYRNGTKKSKALRNTKEFIQIIHHFRDEAITVDMPLTGKVVIFDEAQRAWTRDMLNDFMKRKKGKYNFNQSEPQFLIGVMDRHMDWAIIICLVGGGQEINTGEAGLSEWFESIKLTYQHWDVYVSNQITDSEYSRNIPIENFLQGINYTFIPELHLSVSLRSFRSEKVSAFVKALLDVDIKTAQSLYNSFKQNYPIVITRNLDIAKAWVRKNAKGTQRYGMTASSGARRLRSYGIWVQNKVDAPIWFLNDRYDVRSSTFLEETATEFDIQGLELDWTIVCWDANLRYNGSTFEYYTFSGTRWNCINKPENISYLKNSYRVLLTRARQGFIIFIPEGNDLDPTRKTEFYDSVWEYLVTVGLDIAT